MMAHETQKKGLWHFTDENGCFRVDNPTAVSRLYFPLANDAGLLSSITPELHGDIKTGHNSFLTQPVSIEDLHNTKSNRNFWAYVDQKGAWSLAGISASQKAQRALKTDAEKVFLEAGPLWHKVTRESRSWKLKSEITSFVPSSSDTVEIMIVTLTNIGSTKIRVTPTSAIPIFARSADNLRDHAHVTSLLHRILPHAAGVVVKPTMSFDERGHKINALSYGVLGFQENGQGPSGAFPAVSDFIGEGGDFESPAAVFENHHPPQKDAASLHGQSAIGALRFDSLSLGPGKKASFVLILGIAQNDTDWNDWAHKYGTLAKAEAALLETKAFWKGRLDQLKFDVESPLFNGWARWVSLQPTLRKLFGCSFLPDFDYGRGGRGWRDLWQDCLALLLTSPQDTRKMLLHNFNGIRIDGSNATIIGNGEFIADRNNITRVWMDHGVWPFLTLELYIHQTGDLGILFEQVRYFRDRQWSRAREKDPEWTEAYGQALKSKTGSVVESSVLEHLLVQHLVQFFNVGEHNHIRLENADWNDGLDMAYDRGESVTFTALYGSNLRRLAELVERATQKLGFKKIAITREMLALLDRALPPKINYYSVADKQRRLQKYFDAVQPVVSGKKTEVPVAKLCADLRAKADFVFEHIRKKEWIQTRAGDGLYNGYYDNQGRRVEGDHSEGMLMTLAGQVFPIMSGVATADQVTEIFKTSKKYLKDSEHGGFRLNTNFRQNRLDLGRAFSFSYGDKENGAFFSHMAVMFSNALYQRGFVNEAHEVFDAIYRMCVRTDKSRIYPGIPEYFNSKGRGFYHYLTGSASWLILTLLTQVLGVRGWYGDLLLQPKLVKDQFGLKREASVETYFAGRNLVVTYKNPKKLSYEQYYISKVLLNGHELKEIELHKKEVLVSRDLLEKHAKKLKNFLVVTLE